MSVNIKKGIVLLIPFFILLIFVFLKVYFQDINEVFPTCWIYKNFGIYCPACGNTRCVYAIINGDFISALRLNPFLFMVAVMAVLAYIEQTCAVFFRKVKIIPRKPIFWIGLGTLISVYFVVRNFVPEIMGV